MAKYVHQLVLDNGLNQIKTGATFMVLLKAYTFGDSYATVLSNVIASVAMSTGDFTLSSVGTSRRIAAASKAGVIASGNSGVGPDLHYAFTDGASTVYWVTDEVTDQVVVIGNPINFSSVSYTSGQPS